MRIWSKVKEKWSDSNLGCANHGGCARNYLACHSCADFYLLVKYALEKCANFFAGSRPPFKRRGERNITDKMAFFSKATYTWKHQVVIMLLTHLDKCFYFYFSQWSFVSTWYHPFLLVRWITSVCTCAVPHEGANYHFILTNRIRFKAFLCNRQKHFEMFPVFKKEKTQ